MTMKKTYGQLRPIRLLLHKNNVLAPKNIVPQTHNSTKAMILPLEQTVTSPELSKRLEKLGVPQDSFAYWVQWAKGKWDLRFTVECQIPAELLDQGEAVAALTASEIAVLLPEGFWAGKDKIEGGYTCWNQYWRAPHKYFADKDLERNANTLVESMGRMLEYLLKNNLITLPKP